MGELADRFYRLISAATSVASDEWRDEAAAISVRIEMLEQDNESLASINSDVEQENDRLREINEAAKWSDALPARARSERDRDAALAALSQIAGRSERAIGAFEIEPATAVTANAIHEAFLRQPKIEGLSVVVLAPSTKYNHELLERASTMLAEAYIAAKKEEPK